MTQTNHCIFCEIIDHQLPAAIVYEDDTLCAFLDKRPLFLGHTLLVPKQHYETIFDLPAELNEILFRQLKTLSHVVKTAMDAQGVFVAMNNIVSQSVPHAHFHVVPRNKGDGLRGFFWPRTHYEPGQMSQVAQKLKTCIDKLSA